MQYTSFPRPQDEKPPLCIPLEDASVRGDLYACFMVALGAAVQGHHAQQVLLSGGTGSTGLTESARQA